MATETAETQTAPLCKPFHAASPPVVVASAVPVGRLPAVIDESEVLRAALDLIAEYDAQAVRANTDQKIRSSYNRRLKEMVQALEAAIEEPSVDRELAARYRGLLGAIRARQGLGAEAEYEFSISADEASKARALELQAGSLFNAASVSYAQLGADGVDTQLTALAGLRANRAARSPASISRDDLRRADRLVDQFLRAANVAEKAQLADLATDARLAAARVLSAVGRLREAAAETLGAADQARSITDADMRSDRVLAVSSLQAELIEALMAERVGAGNAGGRSSRNSSAVKKISQSAYGMLSDVIGGADAAGAPELEANARGLLARIYAADGRLNDAIQLTEQALILSGEAGVGDAYIWQGQLGALHRRAGQKALARDAFEAAYLNIQLIRDDLAAQFDELTGRSVFLQSVEPITLAYVDLLLGDDAPTDDILAARDAVGFLKDLEFQQFLGSPCAETKRDAPLEQAPYAAAVVYPIVLADRVELIVTTTGAAAAPVVAHRSAPIDPSAFAETLVSFRDALQSPDPSAPDLHLLHGRRLYDWLVKPIEAILRETGASTVIFAPYGALRTIPLAALHDGQSYFIETYAVTTTVGHSLPVIERADLDGERSYVLAGLALGREVPDAAGVRGLAFDALDGVEAELNALQRQLNVPDALVIKNEQFTNDRLYPEDISADGVLDDPKLANVIHLASHAVFQGRPEESFLLTYDASEQRKLDINELKEAFDERSLSPDQRPLDLLTLSACETAAGDDRSVLGLGGVAAKAGVRSVLASLWPVLDEATPALMEAFYGSLDDGAAKAQALRAAQISMLQSNKYAHPEYWSAFTLIGHGR